LRLLGIFNNSSPPLDPSLSLPLYGAAFRALRFNRFFTTLELSEVSLKDYTHDQKYAWASYLAECLLHNSSLQALVFPLSLPLDLPLQGWVTLNRALCLCERRPRVCAWSLPGARIGEENLRALLPAWSRLFAGREGGREEGDEG